jgi:hypothetical protein
MKNSTHPHVITDKLVQIYMGSRPNAYANRKVQKGEVGHTYTRVDQEAEKQ